MALVFKPPFVQTANDAVVAFVNADGTAIKTILTAGAQGTRIDKFGATSTDTAARIAQIYLHNGSSAFLIGSVTISAGAGNDGTTAAVNLFDTGMLPFLLSDGILTLPTGWSLRLAMQTAVTAAKTVTAFASAGDF